MGAIHFTNGFQPLERWKSAVAGSVGEIICFADNHLRENFLWPDGSPIDATEYPELYQVAVDSGWKQDASGNYLLPDLQGRFLLAGNAYRVAGDVGGEEMHTLTIDEMPAHVHELPNYDNCNINGSNERACASTAQSRSMPTLPTGGSQPHNNMPPFIVVSMQIRARKDVIIQNLCPYEIGDILHTKSDVDPAERWPGTEWTQIDTFLMGAGTKHTLGETGGEETHTLITNELPPTNIQIEGHYMGDRLLAQWKDGVVQIDTTNMWSVGLGYWAKGGKVVQTVGGSQPHNNLPPYTVVYIWERTA